VSSEVRLRPVTEADIPLMFSHQADPVAVRRVVFTSRDYTTFVLHWQRVIGDARFLVRVILEDERLVGNIGAFERNGVREMGYWLDRDAWGRGIATRAVTLFLDLERTRPLHAGVAPHNTASLRVLAKCGFVITGESDGFVTLVLAP
jgi:RimJ/RimL family protein N-acetyltransferase